MRHNLTLCMSFLSSADFFLQNLSFLTTFIRMSNSLDPDQDRCFVQVLIWVKTVCKIFQQMTKVATDKIRVN